MSFVQSYSEALEYLYKQLPTFQKQGERAFKKSLNNIFLLCEYLQNPQEKIKTIHIGGTNGKGSSAHFTAAILQASGYKTGLYTSPHLVSFTERIRINGQEIKPYFVVDFVNEHHHFIEKIKPSFFEVTVAMAFKYFADQEIQIAVIEVGLGGRLDSTNIIHPEVSLITNISLDHQAILGDTIQEIAFEKGGIIKPNAPVVISETQDELVPIFKKLAIQNKSKIVFADQKFSFQKHDHPEYTILKNNNVFLSKIKPELIGDWQLKNIMGVLAAIEELLDFTISKKDIKQGIEHIIKLTHLKGRYQILSKKPLIICDTAHNESGIQVIFEHLKTLNFDTLHLVWGMVSDKDIDKIMKLLPQDANYYFCQPNIIRAYPAKKLGQTAANCGIKNSVVISDVSHALEEARNNAQLNDLIFVGGSTFVVAEILNKS